jgi:trigger factor
MPNVKNTEYQNDITFVLDYLVDEDEYQPWKERLTDQLLKSVEVQGFRKGKVPRDIAIKKVDPALLSETVIKETLERYAQEAVAEMTVKLKQDERVIQNIEINIDPAFTGEQDEGFAFRLIAKLLPQIDLTALDKLKIKEPATSDIANRPSEKEFVVAEKARFLKTYNTYTPSEDKAKKGDKVVCDLNGSVDGVVDSKLKSPGVEIVLGAGDFLPEFEKALPGIKKGESKEVKVTFPESYFEKGVAGKKATFVVECKDVLTPQFQDLPEVFEHNQTVKDQFNSYPEFLDFLAKFYQDETDRLLEEMRQRLIVQSAVSAISDFSLPEDRIESETKRIFAAVKEDSQSKGVSLYEAFSRSGIPSDGASISADEIEVRALIELYVRNEFKLSTILHYIYEKSVEPKISNVQLDRAVEEVKKNPTQFGLSQDTDDETVRRHTMDRLQRQEGARHLFNKFAKPARPAKPTPGVTDVDAVTKEKPAKSAKKASTK